MVRCNRLPVFVLYRRAPSGTWFVVAIGPVDPLVEVSRDGDEIHEALKSTPGGYPDDRREARFNSLTPTDRRHPR